MDILLHEKFKGLITEVFEGDFIWLDSSNACHNKIEIVGQLTMAVTSLFMGPGWILVFTGCLC